MKHLLAATVILNFCVQFFDLEVDAQAPYCPPQNYVPPPIYRASPIQPLMYVRLAGPEGMKVTFFRGQGQAITLAAPFVAGLRPGYTYQLRLSEMKKLPGLAFYPTLEVRGSPLLGCSLRPMDWPAGIFFKEEDFLQALENSLVRKVVFLEKVETALPKASTPDDPLEIRLPRSQDPLAEARERGLPLIILEMGQREAEFFDLNREAVPGTTLLPGDRFLPPPARVPCMPWTCYPIYDPLSGPAPWLFYKLPDGGDWGPPAGFDRFGELRGVDPADTVAEYFDARGQRRLAVSNRVTLCVPRYLVARGEAGIIASALTSKYAADINQVKLAQLALESVRSPKLQLAKQSLEQTKIKQRASGTDNLIGTQITARVQNVEVKVKLAVPESVIGTPKPSPPEALEGEEAPLLIIKWPEDCGGLVGALVTFYIRFTNRGQRPITNVVVTDSLISRFEYVAGTAKTTREASFTTQPNEAGSSILRWEFPGTLQPGESGTVSFRVRIR